MTVGIYAGWESGIHYSEARCQITETLTTDVFEIFFNANGGGYDAGGGDVVVDATYLTFQHGATAASVLGTGEYIAFATALQAVLDAGSTAAGTARGYTVSFDTSTHLYTISISDNDSIAIDFSSFSTAGPVMRQLIGHDGDVTASGNVTSDVRPYYAIAPALGNKSTVTADYEQGGLITGAIANDGSHYSLSPLTMAKQYDWTQEFESSQSLTISLGTPVHKKDATATIPWTWEHFFEHVRGSRPFVCKDDSESIVHFLRPGSAHFAPRRRQPDWDMWDIRLETYLEGRL